MRRVIILALCMFAAWSLSAQQRAMAPLAGFSAETSRTEQDWEQKFRALPSPDNLRDYMKLLSAHPHHVGSVQDKNNAEWIAAKFREWGWDGPIETFEIL